MKESYIHKSASGGDFEQCPVGTHIAICDRIVNVGKQKNEYKGEVKIQNQHYIRWQIPAERVKWTDPSGKEHEGPMVVYKFYTSSLNEKATLRHHIEAWLGVSLEGQDDFGLSELLGLACQVSVGRTSGDKAKVLSVMGVPKGVDVGRLEGETILYDAETAPEDWDKLPEWLQEKAAEGGATPGALQGESTMRLPQTTMSTPEPEFDDDIPF
jgi:hypothetical protein